MRCRFNTSLVYCYETIFKKEIVCISEHGLFQCELNKLNNFHPDYQCMAKASRHLKDIDFGHRPGIGGTAIFWKKELGNRIRKYDKLGSDRICVIQYIADNKQKIYFISMYLPHQTCIIDDFNVELETLRKVCEFCNRDGEVICLGDTNCHLSAAYGIRGYGVTTSHAKKFASTLKCLNMSIVDLSDLCKGECVTWRSDDGKRCSYIDHIGVSKGILSLVKECNVLPDCVSNISDHVAISIELKLPYNRGIDPVLSHQVAWGKADPKERDSLYARPLDKDVENIMLDVGVDLSQFMNNEEAIVNGSNDKTVVEKVLQKIVMCMLWHSSHLPVISYNKHCKPYWNSDLQNLSNIKDKALKDWCCDGRAKSQNVNSYNVLNEARKLFHREHRKCIRNYDVKEMKQFAESGEIDQRYFWWLVNRYKKNVSINPIRSESGDLITEPQEIANEWGMYFQELFSEGRNLKWDEDFKNDVDKAIEMLDNLECSELKGGPICVSEVDYVLKSMKNGKASGWDHIVAEHLKYSGFNLKLALTWLMNSFIVCEYVPIYCKKGLIVPIPKPGKDCSIKDNNRGITLLTVIYKLFEKLLLLRENDFFLKPELCDEIQSAGQEKCSCLHTSFLTQECIAYNVNRGATVYCGSCDTKKAFDTVWINGLLYKLYILGIDFKIWKMIRSAYTNFQCAVMIGGRLSHWFTIGRGVHQGGPLSMKLYVAYNNEMIKMIKNSCYGACIGCYRTGAPGHADDVCLLTLYKSGLNECFKICVQYSFKWRYDFNYDKTVVLIWGKDTDPDLDCIMDGNIIEPKMSAKHMGVMLCTDKNSEKLAIEERIGKARGSLMAARGIGSRSVRVPPTALSKLYWSVSMPKLCYGLDVTNIDNSNMTLLETNHRINSKIVQGVDMNVATPAPLACVGWLSFTAYIDFTRIMFLFRTLCLPDDNMYKSVLIYRLNSLRMSNESEMILKSPVKMMFDTAVKYGLDEIILKCVDENDFSNVCYWKSFVKKIIWDVEKYRWRSTCSMYPNLSYYNKHIDKISMHSWWLFVNKYPYMSSKVSALFSVLMGSEPRGLHIYDKNIFNYCTICQNNERNDHVHILFKCIATENERSKFLLKLNDSMPCDLLFSYMSMSEHDRVGFLLSGFNIKYSNELDSVYIATANFIFNMYKRRYEIYDERNKGVT